DLDPAVFGRFADRLSYVQGDFADAATYERVATAIKGAEQPVFYLEIPPFLFGTVVKGLADAGLTGHARGVRWASGSVSTCGSPTPCSSRSGIGTASSACRSRWPRASGSRTGATS